MSEPFFPSIEDRMHFKRHHAFDFRRRPNKVIIWRAMERITRDRYLPPSEVRKTALALCTSITWRPENVIKVAYRLECESVGMFKGEPLLTMSNKNYRDLVLELRKAELVKVAKRKPFHYELTLLNFFLKHGY